LHGVCNGRANDEECDALGECVPVDDNEVLAVGEEPDVDFDTAAVVGEHMGVRYRPVSCFWEGACHEWSFVRGWA
jgi:hypothetical protein